VLLLLGRGLQNVGSLLECQGAVLSPTLFNVFTSDSLTLTDVQLMTLFADDLALFSSHAKADVIIDRLLSALNTIKRYFSTWRIKLNSSKTQAYVPDQEKK
jgi:hypothetical protein